MTSPVRPAPVAARWRIAAALAAGALLGAAAAPSPAAYPEPVRGGVLRFAVDAEPSNLDCQANVSFAFLHILAPFYSTLLKFDTENYPAIVGDLAQSWTVSADQLTYQFKLRHGVLFHDGAVLTAADVKASYLRLIHPPPGVVSERQVDYAAIASIDTPDRWTLVFHLRWPDATMLANFASPWTCIYQAAKLATDPQFPASHVLGTGPFVFAGHVAGHSWTGRRWEHYFQPGKPYLDGFEADVMGGAAAVAGLENGTIMAEFRSVTPAERDELVSKLGDKLTVRESPWLINLMLVFNTEQKPFDDVRVRRALSLAIDRWDMADSLSQTTFLKFVGGLMRPGSDLAAPEETLTAMPGYSRDIEAARTQARRLLAEAGQTHLSLQITNRDIPVPYDAAAQAVIAAWAAVGVTATQVKLDTKGWQGALEKGQFAAAMDFDGDFADSPSYQLAKYVSRDLSPSNYSASTDRLLDSLYIGQVLTANSGQRAQIVRSFEQRVLSQAYEVPLLWWNRIVVTSASVQGWGMTPSHYLGQDLGDVWLAR